MNLPYVYRGGGKVSPVQKHCTSLPHEEATLPSWLPLPWPSPLSTPLPSLTPTLLPLLSPSPLQLPIAIVTAINIAAVAVNHHCCHLCCIAVSHCCCRCPCRWTLLSPSSLAIAVATAVGHHRHHAVGHFQELLPWCGKNCI
jgi:hypothetical protein